MFNWSLFLSSFSAIFIAELGDKTQLTVFSLAGGGTGGPAASSRVSVFAGAALALVLSTAIAVLAGDAVTRVIPPIWIRRAAGVVFIVLGAWYLYPSNGS